MSGWGDARTSGNNRWQQPTAENTNWRPPGHDRMFDRRNWDEDDDPGRVFTSKRKHGLWGKWEFYDARGRKIG